MSKPIGCVNSTHECREEIAKRVFHEYYSKLVRLASGRIPQSCRRRFEPEDAVQSAMKSFFVRYLEQGHIEIVCSNELESLLAAIVIRKVANNLRRHFAEKRDVRTEFHPTQDNTLHLSYSVIDQIDSRDPCTLDVLVFQETIEAIPEGRLREIAWMRLAGLKDGEISRLLNCSSETIRLGRAKIQRIWLGKLNER